MNRQEEREELLQEIRQNEEKLEVLRKEQKRLEELEDDLEAAHRKLLNILYGSSGWRGEQAVQLAVLFRRELRQEKLTGPVLRRPVR